MTAVAIFIGFVAFLFWWSWFMGRKAKSADSFFVAGRRCLGSARAAGDSVHAAELPHSGGGFAADRTKSRRQTRSARVGSQLASRDRTLICGVVPAYGRICRRCGLWS